MSIAASEDDAEVAAREPRLPAALQAHLQQQIEQGTLELPLLPGVAAEVIAATSREDTDARKLAELVRRDQALAANLLRIANSPLYKPRSPIVSLQQAVSRLGLRALREMALIITCQTRVFRAAGYEDQARALYRHSLAAALFAQEIARLKRWNVEEAFLGGLLHDFGRPVLLQTISDLALLCCTPVEPAAVGRTVDLLHASVGSTLCGRWGLPARLGETVLHHHAPAAAPNCAQAAWLTSLADDLAHQALADRPIDEGALAAHVALAPLNLYPDDLAALQARASSVLETVEAIG